MTAKPTDPHIGLVVEGAGEVPALPLLIRRYLRLQGDYRDIVGKPIACHGRDKALRDGGVESKVAVAAARPGCRCVLVVLDSEGDPTCELGPALLARARKISRVPVEMVLAEGCFEDWLVASAETLGVGEIVFDGTMNGVAQIKRALHPVKYVKPTWQPRLTERMDFDVARARSTSLDRLLKKLDALAARIGEP